MLINIKLDWFSSYGEIMYLPRSRLDLIDFALKVLLI